MTDYDPFAQTFSNSRKNLHWPEVDFILSDIEKNGYESVLDIGCGNGRFIGEFRKKFPGAGVYLGVDASNGMIEEARQYFPKEVFLVSSMPELKNIPKKGTFDTIILLASFHHLKNEAERILCLKRLKDLLSPKGAVYMTNWNLLEQEKYQKNHLGNGDFEIKIGNYMRYYHGFTLPELESLFGATGWKIEENRVFEGGRNIYSKIILAPILHQHS